MRKYYAHIFLLLLIVFGFCVEASAAKVLQVSSSSTLLIGDHNRTYKVKLNCLDISPDKEERAFNWLKSELPRYTRVNIRPNGSEDGILLARVIPLGDNIDIEKKLEANGLASNSC